MIIEESVEDIFCFILKVQLKRSSFLHFLNTNHKSFNKIYRFHPPSCNPIYDGTLINEMYVLNPSLIPTQVIHFRD